MKYLLSIMVSALILSGCVYENEEEAYYSEGNKTNTLDSGLLAHFTFDQSLVDSSGHNIPGVLKGETAYANDPFFRPFNKVLKFNGADNSFEIPVGTYDTISISMFFKSDDPISAAVHPCLLDYGSSAITLNLDAVSGGTYLSYNSAHLDDPSENWVSSFEGWNHIYLEAVCSQKHLKIICDSKKKPGLVLTPSIAEPIILKDGLVVVGKNVSGILNESYFKGSIDEIRIYNRSLTENELYRLTKALH